MYRDLIIRALDKCSDGQLRLIWLFISGLIG